MRPEIVAGRTLMITPSFPCGAQTDLVTVVEARSIPGGYWLTVHSHITGITYSLEISIDQCFISRVFRCAHCTEVGTPGRPCVCNDSIAGGFGIPPAMNVTYYRDYKGPAN